MAEKSRLRQALSRWADSSEAHQRDLRQSHATNEAIAIADAPEREHVVVNGVPVLRDGKLTGQKPGKVML